MAEILAPCGSFEGLKVAIASGADAVYLGLNRFNARLKAENFTQDNLKNAVEYAHLFNRKVYLAINTAIKESEYDDLKHEIICAKQANIDAFIISDLGVLDLINTHAPLIPINASTQMGIQNLEGARMIESLGFDRVILARETKLEDIKLIKENTSLEIEYFVHGAMCVAFSGACLFSAINNSNSGNRGLCLQPCRKRYISHELGIDGYLLSIKDQCQVANIQNLMDLGVDSFKIEGRMKSNEYIAQSVKLYKDALKKGEYNKTTLQNLKIAYNRGNYTKGYNFEKGKIIFPNIQGNYGFKVGNIIERVSNKKYVITSLLDLEEGDGVKIINESYEVGGFKIGKIKKISNKKYEIVSNREYPIGSSVHLTFSKKLKEDALSKKIKLNLSCKFTGEIGERASIELKYKNIKISYTSSFVVEKAKTASQSVDDIKKQLIKTSNTDFSIEKIDITISKDIFIPNSVLNEMKRKALGLIKDEIIKSYTYKQRRKRTQVQSIKSYNKTNRIYEVDEEFDLSLISGASVVLNPSDFTRENCDIFIKNALNNSNIEAVYLKLPVIADGEDIKVIRNILERYDKLHIFASNYYALDIAKELSRRVIYSMNFNFFNYKAISTFGEEIIFVNSVELSEKEQLKSGYTFLYGYVPLMHLRHSPVREFTTKKDGDIKKISYQDSITSFDIDSVKLNDYQYILYNDRKINLIGKKKYDRAYINFSKVKDKNIIRAILNNKSFSEENVISTIRGVL